jgi:hypothetical protein
VAGRVVTDAQQLDLFKRKPYVYRGLDLKPRCELVLEPGKNQIPSSYSQYFYHLTIAASSFRQWRDAECPQEKVGDMTELFYWKELERRARAAQALAMLNNRTHTSGVKRGQRHSRRALPRSKGAERLIRSRMPPRPDARPKPSTASAIAASPRDAASLRRAVYFR